jgi:hypothetical protein
MSAGSLVAFQGEWARQVPLPALRPRIRVSPAQARGLLAALRVAMGAGLGAAFGAATGNMAFWLATGVALGTGLGAIRD